MPQLLGGRNRVCVSSSPFSPQIPIAVSGVRGMGFLMKHHIEAGGGQLPAKLSSLFIKVSGVRNGDCAEQWSLFYMDACSTGLRA